MPPMTGQQALDALRAAPVPFLQTHRLVITALFDPTGPDQVWLYNDNQHFGGHDSFSMASGDPGIGAPVQLAVFGVQVLPFAAVNPAALPAAQLPAVGADFMATALLTGCAVVMQPLILGSGPFVAHIQPDIGQTGEQLQAQLQGARFAGSAHATGVYGRLNYPQPQRATVIGLRDGAHWTLYAQAFGALSIANVQSFPLS
jgi:hypothetical protein